eukprot:scaffold149007_cov21-Tisochrysis_lutea.AAC.2
MQAPLSSSQSCRSGLSTSYSSLPSRSLRTPALHSWPNTCRCGQHAGVSSSNRFSRFSSSILQGRGYQCSPLSLRASTSDDEGGTLTKPRPKGLTTVEDEGFNFQSFLKSELPGKLAILLSLVVVSRLGVYVRLPGVDVDGFSAMMQNMHAAADIRVIQLSLKVLKLQDAQWLDRIAMSNCVQMLLHTWQKGHKVLCFYVPGRMPMPMWEKWMHAYMVRMFSVQCISSSHPCT